MTRQALLYLSGSKLQRCVLCLFLLGATILVARYLFRKNSRLTSTYSLHSSSSNTTPVVDNFDSVHPHILQYVRDHLWDPPSLPGPPRLANPGKPKNDYSQIGQSLYIDALLKGRRNGFYVEAGAADGEAFSNSLFFELERNWTGLLVEGSPQFHAALREKNRRAHVLRACLSTSRRPEFVTFKLGAFAGGIAERVREDAARYAEIADTPEMPVLCFPLNSVFAALNVTHVDYLTLDVEGPELEILESIDWKRVRIDVMTIEYNLIESKLEQLRRFFRSTGLYREVGMLPEGWRVGQDLVVMRTDI